MIKHNELVNTMTEFKFTDEQLSIISELTVTTDLGKFEDVIQRGAFVELNNDEQLSLLIVLNACFRGGFRAMEDAHYDVIHDMFAKNNPNHPFITAVEPEVLNLGKMVSLPQKMLSTD